MNDNYPKTDVSYDTTGKMLNMFMAVPGCTVGDLKVTYEGVARPRENPSDPIKYNHKITVSGKMNDEYRFFDPPSFTEKIKESPSYKAMYLRELKHSFFSRTFLYDHMVFGDSKPTIYSTLKDGILIITIPLSGNFVVPSSGLERCNFTEVKIEAVN